MQDKTGFSGLRCLNGNAELAIYRVLARMDIQELALMDRQIHCSIHASC